MHQTNSLALPRTLPSIFLLNCWPQFNQDSFITFIITLADAHFFNTFYKPRPDTIKCTLLFYEAEIIGQLSGEENPSI